MPIIHVSELYGPTIQGEGRTAGMPCFFLRTSACNLTCVFCDTPYTWNWIGTKFKHPQKFDKTTESHKVKSDDLLAEIKKFGEEHKVKALVVTGGEPLLQQNRLHTVLKPLHDDKWWIELETNGTLLLTRVMAECIDQINCSPKLANSDEPLERRIKPEVLKVLATAERVIFKFVVGGYEDAEEIKAIVELADIAPDKIWIMPKAMDREEHARSEAIANYVAKSNGWNYTPRHHILRWGNKRRV